MQPTPDSSSVPRGVRAQALAWTRFDAPIIGIVSLALFYGLPVGDYAAQIAFFLFGFPAATFTLLYRVLDAALDVCNKQDYLRAPYRSDSLSC